MGNKPPSSPRAPRLIYDSTLLHEAQKANMLHMLTQANQAQVYDAPRLRPL
jgi:hypothetical protein